MRRGYAYLVAVMDWASRKTLFFRLSSTMDASFCAEALGEAISHYGAPEIFDTDQGSQFTSDDFTDVLKSHDIRISMDGRGRFPGNLLVERLGRSVKCEEVHLKAYGSLREARRNLAEYFEFYNARRRHQILDYQMPDEVLLGYASQGRCGSMKMSSASLKDQEKLYKEHRPPLISAHLRQR